MHLVKREKKIYIFKHIFSVFKQYYTYFYTLFSPTNISKKTENYCLNIRTKQTLSMCLQMDGVAFLLHFSLRKKKKQKQKSNITKEKKKKKSKKRKKEVGVVLSKYFSHFSLQFREIVFWKGRRENLWAPPLFSPPPPLKQTVENVIFHSIFLSLFSIFPVFTPIKHTMSCVLLQVSSYVV